MATRSKLTPAIVKSARVGGAAAKSHGHDGPALEDLLPYAPRVDRADFSAWTVDDTCPQLRINY